MEAFRADVTAVGFLVGVGLPVGDQGGNTVECLATYLDKQVIYLN